MRHSEFPNAKYAARQAGGAVTYYFDEKKVEIGWAIDEKVFLKLEKPRVWHQSFLDKMEWTVLN